MHPIDVLDYYRNRVLFQDAKARPDLLYFNEMPTRREYPKPFHYGTSLPQRGTYICPFCDAAHSRPYHRLRNIRKHFTSCHHHNGV